MRARLAKGSTPRIVLTSALVSILVLTPLTYGLDAAGGHPAKSAPIVLWVFWFLLIVSVRLLMRLRRRRSLAMVAVPQPVVVAADSVPMTTLATTGVATIDGAGHVGDRLQVLDRLYDQKLVTEAEYAQKRADILAEL